ncbi:MAG: hypothetical protein HY951_06430 [Bacteroidia bacterium]|nr:hypothetical protein [Bacteroidia bacterium]
MIRLILLFIFFLTSLIVQSQNIFKIFKDDTIFIKKKGLLDGFNYSLKDSLPDGKYILFNLEKKDSSSENLVINFQGEYKERLKEGEFIQINYNVNNGKLTPSYIRQCNYKTGLKNGIEESWWYCKHGLEYNIIMEFRGEYKQGRKNGLFLYYDEGCLNKIIEYENDSLKRIVFEDNNSYLMKKDLFNHFKK